MEMANFFQWNGSTTNGAAYITSVRGTPIVVVSATLTATLTTDTTYTSVATSLLEFNSILVQTTLGTGAKTVTTIFGAMSSGGTMVAVFDKDTSAQMTTGSISSSRTQKFTGLPDYIGFSTVFSSGATAGSSFSVTIQPLNL